MNKFSLIFSRVIFLVAISSASAFAEPAFDHVKNVCLGESFAVGAWATRYLVVCSDGKRHYSKVLWGCYSGSCQDEAIDKFEATKLRALGYEKLFTLPSNNRKQRIYAAASEITASDLKADYGCGYFTADKDLFGKNLTASWTLYLNGFSSSGRMPALSSTDFSGITKSASTLGFVPFARLKTWPLVQDFLIFRK